MLRGLALLLTLWFATLMPGDLSLGLCTVGLGLLAAGAVLRQWAIRTLGAGFGVDLAPSIPLRTDGPYRWSRHPSEWGLILMVLGTLVMMGSTWGVAAWVLLVVAPSLRRMVREDQALALAAVESR